MHHGADQYRTLDSERGVLTSLDGRRAVLLSSSFVFGLTRTLDAESPGVAELTLYTSGTSWGRLYTMPTRGIEGPRGGASTTFPRKRFSGRLPTRWPVLAGAASRLISRRRSTACSSSS